jgi:hypothetical protein
MIVPAQQGPSLERPRFCGGFFCLRGDSRLGCPSLGEARRHVPDARVRADAFVRPAEGSEACNGRISTSQML